MTRLRIPEQPVGPVRIDLIAASHPFYERIIARSRTVKGFDLRLRFASPEDVILLKLIADRPQDRADVLAIAAAQGDRLDRELLRTEAESLELVFPPGLAETKGEPGNE